MLQKGEQCNQTQDGSFLLAFDCKLMQHHIHVIKTQMTRLQIHDT